ncbi:methyltransferase [candidate division KSB1 bacterium]
MKILRNIQIICTKLILLLFIKLRSIPFLTFLLFHVNINTRLRIHWDFTSLILKKSLKIYLKPNYNVLEIGTGPYALLSIWAKKNFNCEITACDIQNSYVKNAVNTAKINGVELDIIQSDLFDNVSGKYELIFFNTVYIPYKIGIDYGINKDHLFETDWCGGQTGYETIELFLKSATDFLKSNGIILLGFNEKYVKEISVSQICRSYNYSIQDNIHSLMNPSKVIVLKRRNL